MVECGRPNIRDETIVADKKLANEIKSCIWTSWILRKCTKEKISKMYSVNSKLLDVVKGFYSPSKA